MNQYGNRYIKIDDFGKYYHEIAESKDQVYSVFQFKKELEFYEREELLFPFRRVVFPEEYVRFFSDLRHNPGNPFYHEAQFQFPENWPDEWIKLYDVIRSESLWRIPSGKRLIHPFDEAQSLQDYFIDPIKTEFQPWESYKVKVLFEGKKCKEDRAVPYYSYWQIHQLYAVRQNNRLELLLNLQNDETQKEIWHRQLLPEKIFTMKIPLRHKQKERGDFLGINRWFGGLSLYVQMKQRERDITFRFEAVEEGHRRVLKGRAFENYKERCRQHGGTVFKLYQFSVEELYNFLKLLAILFFEYQDAGRIRLSEELSDDIWHLIEFISFAENKSFEEINAKVGRLGGYLRNALDVIFPNEMEDAKEDTLMTLEDRSQKYKKAMTDKNYHLGEDDLKALVAFMEEHDLSIFFQTITGLNKDWFKHTAFSANNLLIHLRNLSILVESVVKEIGKNSKDSTMQHEFLNAPAQEKGMKDVLKRMFRGEPWWSDLAGNWTDYTVDFSNLEDKLVALSGKKTFRQTKWHDFVIKNFLISGVMRNFTTHETVQHKGLFRYHYVEVIDALLYSLLFIWAYSKLKGLT